MIRSHGETRSSLATQHTKRRMLSVLWVVLGLCTLTAIADFDILSKQVRKLCKTIFNYPDWDQYWEDLFAAKVIYDGSKDRQLVPSNSKNIGYFLTLASCPADSYTAGDPNDPGHAFYDAAAVLKHSIYRNTYPADSAYNATMYAIVHPLAVRCLGPDGEEYDRVQVLKDLGYIVTILGSPVYPKIMTPYLKENVNKDAGERDFMKLHSLTYDNHPAIVLVDFTTLMMKPMDDVFDSFIGDPDKKISFTYDYPTNLPNTGKNVGINTHWIIMKPDRLFFKTLAEAYRDATYDPKMGWNWQGIKDFKGVLGLKGFLVHYFTRVDKGSHEVLSRCHFGNDNSDPYGIDPSGNRVCRDPMDCADCRTTDIKSVRVLKLIHTCGKPWECSYDESWDPVTKAACENFHRRWFSARVSFEETCWVHGPPSYRTGPFKPEVFLGFCSCSGVTCYDLMIDDKAAPTVCDAHTQTNFQIGRMTFPNEVFQDLKLSVTTGQVTGSKNVCLNGTISLDGVDPPYNIAFVIDTSESTKMEFKGSPVGDVNADGSPNTILDAELAAVIAVLDHIANAPDLGNDNVNIGLISFSTQATYHGLFMPCDPNDPSKKNPDLMAELSKFRASGLTHFDDALDKAVDFFNEAPQDRSNLLAFLSDGLPNVVGDGDNEEPTNVYKENQPGALDYTSELEALDALRVRRMAIGVGAGSDVRPEYGLDIIDNTPDPYTGIGPTLATTTDVLKLTLLSSPIAGEVIEFSVAVNGVIQPAIDNTHVVSGPTGYSFGRFVVTGLDPSYGSLNSVKVTALLDFDGVVNTKDDQVRLEVENIIPGTLF